MAIKTDIRDLKDKGQKIFFGRATGRIARMIAAKFPFTVVNDSRKETEIVDAKIIGYELRKNQFNQNLPESERDKDLLVFICQWGEYTGIEIKCNDPYALDYIAKKDSNNPEDYKIKFRVVESKIEDQWRVYTEMASIE